MNSSSSSEEVLSDPLLDKLAIRQGYKVLDRCVIYTRLGQGGMGAVYHGRHLKLEIDVAVKCLKPGLDNGSGEFIIRFQREARVAAGINCENLVRVFDVDETDGLHYLIMEYVEGENLRERVKRKGALSAEESATIILGAARGLAAAHSQGIVHRDIKPDNIMVSRTGEVKVADLGLARASDALDSLNTATGMVMGTPQYMPPEQFENTSTVGPAGDVWAMGAVVYFLLTGEDGIERGSLPEVMRKVCIVGFPSPQDGPVSIPEPLCAIIQRCTQDDPNNRFEDGAALTEAVAEFLQAAGQQTVLSDALAGGERMPSMVSPPPPKTLAKIKLEIDEDSRRESKPQLKSPTHRKKSPTKSKKGPAIAILCLLVAATIFFAADPFGFLASPKKEPTEKASRTGKIPSKKENTEDGSPEKEIKKSNPSKDLDNATKKALQPSTKTTAEKLTLAKKLSQSNGTLAEAVAILKSILVDEDNREAKDLLFECLKVQVLNLKADKKFFLAMDICLEALKLKDTDSALAKVKTWLEDEIRAEMIADVQISRPGAGDVVGKKVIIEGRIESNRVLDLLFEKKKINMVGGRFLIDWEPRATGETSVPIAVRSRHGIVAEVVRKVGVDVSPPVIKITTPLPAELSNSRSITVRGSAFDDLGVARVVVAGKSVELDSSANFLTDVKFESDGAQGIKVVAFDRSGKETETVCSIVIDTKAPLIRLLPVIGSRTARPLKVVVKVTDASTVSVNMNGRKAKLLGGNEFEGELKAGEEELVVVAIDEAMNQGTLKEAFLINMTPDWANAAPGVEIDKKTGLPKEVTDKRTGIVMKLIPAGSFWQGASANDDLAEANEKPRHQVNITKPFYLGKFEVTNEQFRLDQSDHDSKDYKGETLNGAKQPAVYVSWDEAQAFCTKFNFRLPTEAQWEYAARAGTTERYLWGHDAKDGKGWGNFLGPKAKSKFEFSWDSFPFDDDYLVTAPVGQFQANSFGLHDMIGNVWEWCRDYYDGEFYSQLNGNNSDDPENKVKANSRLLRGGSWYFGPGLVSSSNRLNLDPANEDVFIGFRVSRTP